MDNSVENSAGGNAAATPADPASGDSASLPIANRAGVLAALAEIFGDPGGTPGAPNLPALQANVRAGGAAIDALLGNQGGLAGLDPGTRAGLVGAIQEVLLQALTEGGDPVTTPPAAGAAPAAPTAYSPLGYGAVGDGAADDTAAVQAAIAAAQAGAGVVTIPPNLRFKVTATLTITAPLTVRGPGVLLFAFPSALKALALFDVSSSNVTFENLIVDGSPMGGGFDANLVTNRYGIYAHGAGADTHLDNIMVRNCQFSGLTTYWYNNTGSVMGGGPHNGVPAQHSWQGLTVCHAVYMENVDHPVVDRCLIDSPSGAGVFLRSTQYATVSFCEVREPRWYGIHLDADNHDWAIMFNRVVGVSHDCRYYGGSYDIMGQHSGGLPVDSQGLLLGNYASGVHIYGSAYRFSSSRDIAVVGNIADGITVSPDVATFVSCFAVAGRGASGAPGVTPTDMSDRAPRHFLFHSNICIAGPAQVPNSATGVPTNIAIMGIYVQNPTPPFNPRYPTPAGYQVNRAEGFTITGNHFICPSATDFFQNSIILHGQDGGISNGLVAGNQCWGRPLNVPNPPGSAAPLPGGICITGVNPQAGNPLPWACRPTWDIQVVNNYVKWYQGPSGTELSPAPVYAYGIALISNLDRITVAGNVIEGFNIGLTLDSTAVGDGTQATDMRSLDQNRFVGSVRQDLALAPNARVN